jgi:hypothetical protein
MKYGTPQSPGPIFDRLCDPHWCLGKATSYTPRPVPPLLPATHQERMQAAAAYAAAMPARATARKAGTAKQTLSLLQSWMGGEGSVSVMNARASSRESKSLALSWMSSAQPHAVTGRAAQRDSHSLFQSWMAAATPAPVSARATARDNMSLIKAWAGSAASTQAVNMRAGARDAKPWVLLHSWIVREGFAKQGPVRQPVSSFQLFYSWIVSAGISRLAVTPARVCVRGFKPASKAGLLHSWLVQQGPGRNVSEFTTRLVKMGLSLSAAFAIGLSVAPLAHSMWKNPEVKKLVRRSSISSARQGVQKLKLA